MSEQESVINILKLENRRLKTENERLKKAAKAILNEIPPIDRHVRTGPPLEEFEKVLGLYPTDEFGRPLEEPTHGK